MTAINPDEAVTLRQWLVSTTVATGRGRVPEAVVASAIDEEATRHDDWPELDGERRTFDEWLEWFQGAGGFGRRRGNPDADPEGPREGPA